VGVGVSPKRAPSARRRKRSGCSNPKIGSVSLRKPVLCRQADSAFQAVSALQHSSPCHQSPTSKIEVWGGCWAFSTSATSRMSLEWLTMAVRSRRPLLGSPRGGIGSLAARRCFRKRGAFRGGGSSPKQARRIHSGERTQWGCPRISPHGQHK
jgi:hypothetical protein